MKIFSPSSPTLQQMLFVLVIIIIISILVAAGLADALRISQCGPDKNLIINGDSAWGAAAKQLEITDITNCAITITSDNQDFFLEGATFSNIVSSSITIVKCMQCFNFVFSGRIQLTSLTVDQMQAGVASGSLMDPNRVMGKLDDEKVDLLSFSSLSADSFLGTVIISNNKFYPDTNANQVILLHFMLRSSVIADSITIRDNLVRTKYNAKCGSDVVLMRVRRNIDGNPTFLEARSISVIDNTLTVTAKPDVEAITQGGTGRAWRCRLLWIKVHRFNVSESFNVDGNAVACTLQTSDVALDLAFSLTAGVAAIDSAEQPLPSPPDARGRVYLPFKSEKPSSSSSSIDFSVSRNTFTAQLFVGSVPPKGSLFNPLHTVKFMHARVLELDAEGNIDVQMPASAGRPRHIAVNDNTVNLRASAVALSGSFLDLDPAATRIGFIWIGASATGIFYPGHEESRLAHFEVLGNTVKQRADGDVCGPTFCASPAGIPGSEADSSSSSASTGGSTATTFISTNFAPALSWNISDNSYSVLYEIASRNPDSIFIIIPSSVFLAIDNTNHNSPARGVYQFDVRRNTASVTARASNSGKDGASVFFAANFFAMVQRADWTHPPPKLSKASPVSIKAGGMQFHDNVYLVRRMQVSLLALESLTVQTAFARFGPNAASASVSAEQGYVFQLGISVFRNNTLWARLPTAPSGQNISVALLDAASSLLWDASSGGIGRRFSRLEIADCSVRLASDEMDNIGPGAPRLTSVVQVDGLVIRAASSFVHTASTVFPLSITGTSVSAVVRSVVGGTSIYGAVVVHVLRRSRMAELTLAGAKVAAVPNFAVVGVELLNNTLTVTEYHHRDVSGAPGRRGIPSSVSVYAALLRLDDISDAAIRRQEPIVVSGNTMLFSTSDTPCSAALVAMDNCSGYSSLIVMNNNMSTRLVPADGSAALVVAPYLCSALFLDRFSPGVDYAGVAVAKVALVELYLPLVASRPFVPSDFDISKLSVTHNTFFIISRRDLSGIGLISHQYFVYVSGYNNNLDMGPPTSTILPVYPGYSFWRIAEIIIEQNDVNIDVQGPWLVKNVLAVEANGHAGADSMALDSVRVVGNRFGHFLANVSYAINSPDAARNDMTMYVWLSALPVVPGTPLSSLQNVDSPISYNITELICEDNVAVGLVAITLHAATTIDAGNFYPVYVSGFEFVRRLQDQDSIWQNGPFRTLSVKNNRFEDAVRLLGGRYRHVNLVHHRIYSIARNISQAATGHVLDFNSANGPLFMQITSNVFEGAIEFDGNQGGRALQLLNMPAERSADGHDAGNHALAPEHISFSATGNVISDALFVDSMVIFFIVPFIDFSQFLLRDNYVNATFPKLAYSNSQFVFSFIHLAGRGQRIRFAGSTPLVIDLNTVRFNEPVCPASALQTGMCNARLLPAGMASALYPLVDLRGVVNVESLRVTSNRVELLSVERVTFLQMPIGSVSNVIFSGNSFKVKLSRRLNVVWPFDSAPGQYREDSITVVDLTQYGPYFDGVERPNPGAPRNISQVAVRDNILSVDGVATTNTRMSVRFVRMCFVDPTKGLWPGAPSIRVINNTAALRTLNGSDFSLLENAGDVCDTLPPPSVLYFRNDAVDEILVEANSVTIAGVSDTDPAAVDTAPAFNPGGSGFAVTLVRSSSGSELFSVNNLFSISNNKVLLELGFFARASLFCGMNFSMLESRNASMYKYRGAGFVEIDTTNIFYKARGGGAGGGIKMDENVLTSKNNCATWSFISSGAPVDAGSFSVTGNTFRNDALVGPVRLPLAVPRGQQRVVFQLVLQPSTRPFMVSAARAEVAENKIVASPQGGWPTAGGDQGGDGGRVTLPGETAAPSDNPGFREAAAQELVQQQQHHQIIPTVGFRLRTSRPELWSTDAAWFPEQRAWNQSWIFDCNTDLNSSSSSSNNSISNLASDLRRVLTFRLADGNSTNEPNITDTPCFITKTITLIPPPTSSRTLSLSRSRSVSGSPSATRNESSFSESESGTMEQTATPGRSASRGSESATETETNTSALTRSRALTATPNGTESVSREGTLSRSRERSLSAHRYSKTPSLALTESRELTETVHIPKEMTALEQTTAVLQSIAAVASIVSIPAAAVAFGIGRQQSVQALLDGTVSAQCGFRYSEGPVPFAMSPLQLQVSPPGEGDSFRYRYVVGTVVGNICLTLGLQLLFFGTGWLWRCFLNEMVPLTAVAVQVHVTVIFQVFVAVLFGSTLYHSIMLFFLPYMDNGMLALAGCLCTVYLLWIVRFLRATLSNKDTWAVAVFEYDEVEQVPGYEEEEEDETKKKKKSKTKRVEREKKNDDDEKKNDNDAEPSPLQEQQKPLLLELSDSDDDLGLPPPPSTTTVAAEAAARTPSADAADDAEAAAEIDLLGDPYDAETAAADQQKNKNEDGTPAATKAVEGEGQDAAGDDDSDDDDLDAFIARFVKKDLTPCQQCMLRFKQIASYWLSDYGTWRYSRKATPEQRLLFHFAVPLIESYLPTAPRFFLFELGLQVALVASVLVAQLVSKEQSCKAQAMISGMSMACFLGVLLWLKPIQPRIAFSAVLTCVGLEVSVCVLAMIVTPGAAWIKYLQILLLIAQTTLAAVLFIWLVNRVYQSIRKNRLVLSGKVNLTSGTSELEEQMENGDERKLRANKLLQKRFFSNAALSDGEGDDDDDDDDDNDEQQQDNAGGSKKQKKKAHRHVIKRPEPSPAKLPDFLENFMAEREAEFEAQAERAEQQQEMSSRFGSSPQHRGASELLNIRPTTAPSGDVAGAAAAAFSPREMDIEALTAFDEIDAALRQSTARLGMLDAAEEEAAVEMHRIEQLRKKLDSAFEV